MHMIFLENKAQNRDKKKNLSNALQSKVVSESKQLCPQRPLITLYMWDSVEQLTASNCIMQNYA